MKIIKSERQKGCRKDEMVKRQSTRKHKGLTHTATVARNQVYHLGRSGKYYTGKY